MAFSIGGLAGGAGGGAAMGSAFGPYGAAIGAVAGGLSSALRNKARPKAPDFQPYSGYRPPHVNYLRPVEDMITQTLMRRSQGQDVGFDPKRLDELKQNYDINQAQRDERNVADINNELSGIGQSRNLAAREALLGRYKQDQNRERNKYFNQYDIEDLATRNSEKREATQGLQNLNTFNFGQEDQVANFDLAAYNAENNARNAAFGNQMVDYNAYQDPLGDAVSSGLGIYGAGQGAAYNSAIINALNSKSGANQTAPKSTPFVEQPQGQSYYPGVASMYAAPLTKRYKTQGF